GPAGRVERAQGAARAGDRVSQPAAESGGDLLLLPGRGEQPAQRAELLAGALQHLVLALPVRARGPLDLGPGLAEHPREALPHARGDVSRGGSRERGVERVEATGDAWEPDERCVEIAPHRVADAVIGAEVPVIAGGRHARHAGAAGAPDPQKTPIWHRESQAAPGVPLVAPSSHCSPGSTTPFPQTAPQGGRLVSRLTTAVGATTASAPTSGGRAGSR